MKYSLTRRLGLAGLLQFMLLGYFYSDPTGRLLGGWLYGILLTVNSLWLVWLAYQSFQQQRLVTGFAAAVLAFPRLFIVVAALCFLQAKH